MPQRMLAALVSAVMWARKIKTTLTLSFLKLSCEFLKKKQCSNLLKTSKDEELAVADVRERGKRSLRTVLQM